MLCFTGQGVIASNNLHILVTDACYSLVYNLHMVYIYVENKGIKISIMT